MGDVKLQITHNSLGVVEGAILRHFYNHNLEIEHDPNNTPAYFRINFFITDILGLEKEELKKMIHACIKPLEFRYDLTYENDKFCLQVYSSNITIKENVIRHNFNRPKTKEKGNKKNAHRRNKVHS